MTRPRIARLVSLLVVAGVIVVAVRPIAVRWWQTARGDIAPGSLIAHRAVPVGDGVVIVGASQDADSGVPGAWRRSLSDSSWQALGSNSASRQLLDVAVVDDNLIAVGSDDGFPVIVQRDVSVDDGAPWLPAWAMKVPGQQPPGSADGELVAVAADSAEVVAVGTDRRADGPRARIVRRSGSGTDQIWTPSTIETGNSTAFAVTFAGGRAFVAGASMADQRSSRAAVWVSDGSGRWVPEDVPTPSEVRRSMILALAGTANRLVAVGSTDNSPAAWVRDGDTWIFAGPLPDVSVPGRRVTAIGPPESDSGRYLAVGQQTGIGDVQTPLAWSTIDGRTWEPVGVGGLGLTGLVDVEPHADDATLIAVGNTLIRKRISPLVLEWRDGVLQPARDREP